jgi:membrane protein DedA with SNARE-associated domain
LTDSHLFVYLTVFAVTLLDHSAVPNVYVLAMIAAKGKGFSPSALYAVAVVSVHAYEQTVFWMGRFARNRVPKNRFVRRVGVGAAMITGVIARRADTWMFLGRFIGGVGLYIPFAYGQMGRSYFLFCLWSLTGTFFHIAVFGAPAYFLGTRFETVIARIPLGAITVGVFFLMLVPVVWKHLRQRARRRTSGSTD